MKTTCFNLRIFMLNKKLEATHQEMFYFYQDYIWFGEYYKMYIPKGKVKIYRRLKKCELLRVMYGSI